MSPASRAKTWVIVSNERKVSPSQFSSAKKLVTSPTHEQNPDTIIGTLRFREGQARRQNLEGEYSDAAGSLTYLQSTFSTYVHSLQAVQMKRPSLVSIIDKSLSLAFW